MEYPNNPQEQSPIPDYRQYVPRKEMLPGSLATLILGIVSLANMAFLGWIPALIAYSYHKKAMEALENEPGRYSDTSANMARSGKKMAEIGLILGILGMFATGLYYYFIFAISFGRMF